LKPTQLTPETVSFTVRHDHKRFRAIFEQNPSFHNAHAIVVGSLLIVFHLLFRWLWFSQHQKWFRQTRHFTLQHLVTNDEQGLVLNFEKYPYIHIKISMCFKILSTWKTSVQWWSQRGRNLAMFQDRLEVQ